MKVTLSISYGEQDHELSIEVPTFEIHGDEGTVTGFDPVRDLRPVLLSLVDKGCAAIVAGE